jgi:hypothetical protein
MMRGILRYRPSPATAIALTALAVALGGVAYATIPDSNGAIHGCYQKNNGNLRVVQSSGECRNDENALTWNQQGPPASLTTAFAEEQPAVSTGCGGSAAFCSRGSFVDLGGPAVSVTVPSSGLVAAVVRADIQGSVRPPDPGDTFPAILDGCLGLFVDSQPYRGQSDDSAELDCEGGDFRRDYVDWFTFEAPPGPHTISVRYRGKCVIGSHGCSVDQRAFFKNRKLWVTPIG